MPNLREMVELAKSLDRFFFIAGISNVEQYGRYMIIESGHFEYDSELESYIDFEKYGKDRFDRDQGCFSSYGYICRMGSMEEVCGMRYSSMAESGEIPLKFDKKNNQREVNVIAPLAL